MQVLKSKQFEVDILWKYRTNQEQKIEDSVWLIQLMQNNYEIM